MLTGGTTTTSVYVSALESVATTSGITTTTTYYYAAGRRVAVAVNGTLSYLASDLLGSALVALNTSGTSTASQVYAPYGGTRYSSGAMPTDYGFTGQRADAATGLDYYGARYYDPALGQFASADTLLAGGMNRYGYVGGNPINRTDPSGHRDEEEPDAYGNGGTAPNTAGGIGAGVAVGGGAGVIGWLVAEDEAATDEGAAADGAIYGTSPDDISPSVHGADGPNGQTFSMADGYLTNPDAINRGDWSAKMNPSATTDDVPMEMDGSPEFNQRTAPQGNEPDAPTGSGDGSGSSNNGPKPAPSKPIFASGPENAANVDGMYGSGASVSDDNIKLYRAVDDNEYQAMGGRFQYAGSGLKYFTNTQESAEDYATKMIGTRPFHIMSGEVPAGRLLGPDVRTGAVWGGTRMIWENIIRRKCGRLSRLQYKRYGSQPTSLALPDEELAMVEIVLELLRAADEPVVREMVKDRGNLTVTGPNVLPLADRTDIDTILLEDWPAVEWYGGRPPRTLGWVVVDAFDASRVLLYEATVTAFNPESAPHSTAVAWVMSMPHYAPAKLADDGDPEAVREAIQSYEAIPGDEADYPRFLNAFEVMERHNANEAMPPIHRVGIQAIVGWMPALLHAYDTYRTRVFAGSYEGKDRADPPNSSS